jgi:hypothetical protein
VARMRCVPVNVTVYGPNANILVNDFAVNSRPNKTRTRQAAPTLDSLR